MAPQQMNVEDIGNYLYPINVGIWDALEKGSFALFKKAGAIYLERLIQVGVVNEGNVDEMLTQLAEYYKKAGFCESCKLNITDDEITIDVEDTPFAELEQSVKKETGAEPFANPFANLTMGVIKNVEGKASKATITGDDKDLHIVVKRVG